MKRLSLLAVPTLLLGLVLTGCGGDSSSTTASDQPASSSTSAGSDATSSPSSDDTGQAVTAFCNVILGIVSQAPSGTSDADALKLLKSVAAQFEKIGPPPDMPADAQRALQVAIDKINALPDDATAEEVAKAASDLTAAQKKDQAALGEYVQQKCMPSAGSDAPSPSN